jgi:hypothetical protein
MTNLTEGYGKRDSACLAQSISPQITTSSNSSASSSHTPLSETDLAIQAVKSRIDALQIQDRDLLWVKEAKKILTQAVSTGIGYNELTLIAHPAYRGDMTRQQAETELTRPGDYLFRTFYPDSKYATEYKVISVHGPGDDCAHLLFKPDGDKFKLYSQKFQYPLPSIMNREDPLPFNVLEDRGDSPNFGFFSTLDKLVEASRLITNPNFVYPPKLQNLIDKGTCFILNGIYGLRTGAIYGNEKERSAAKEKAAKVLGELPDGNCVVLVYKVYGPIRSSNMMGYQLKYEVIDKNGNVETMYTLPQVESLLKDKASRYHE